MVDLLDWVTSSPSTFVVYYFGLSLTGYTLAIKYKALKMILQHSTSV